MPQFYAEPGRIAGGVFTLAGDEAHHLIKVHRARPGDEIRLFDGSGKRFRGRIDSLGLKDAAGTVLEEIPETVPRYRLTLHVAALPRPKFEEVLEKGTELGVSAFQVVTTPRDVVKASDSDGRVERFGAILMAASKQCLRARLPELLPTAKLAEAFAACPKGTGYLAWEADGGAALTGLPAKGGELHVFIGPEGGFTPEDVTRAKAAGIRTFGLGENILRAETAALAAAALFLLAP